MGLEIDIEPIDPGSPLLAPLAAEARAQGYRFMDRLLDEARSETNLFREEGECFCGAFVDGVLAACGGLNRDPHSGGKVGRLRRIYVLRAHRRNGVAAALVEDLLRRGGDAFEIVRLRVPDERAGAFYDALGFARIDEDAATHRIEVRRHVPSSSKRVP